MNKLKKYHSNQKINFETAEKLKVNHKLKIDNQQYKIIKISRDINLFLFN